MAGETWETMSSQKVRLDVALGVEKRNGEAEVAQVWVLNTCVVRRWL